MFGLITHLLQSSTDFNSLDLPIPGPFEVLFGCGIILLPLFVVGLLGYFIGKSRGRVQGRNELLEELETKRDLDPPPPPPY